MTLTPSDFIFARSSPETLPFCLPPDQGTLSSPDILRSDGWPPVHPGRLWTSRDATSSPFATASVSRGLWPHLNAVTRLFQRGHFLALESRCHLFQALSGFSPYRRFVDRYGRSRGRGRRWRRRWVCGGCGWRVGGEGIGLTWLNLWKAIWRNGEIVQPGGQGGVGARCCCRRRRRRR